MKKFGLIGNPLAHSFSEKFFTEKFKRESIQDCSYKLFPLQRIDQLPALLEKENLQGFNVTIPYKESVLSYLNQLSDEAKQIGAVNCVLIEDEKLIGHNTDVFGFEVSISQWLNKPIKQALILGNGGSAKAVKFALKRLEIPFEIVSRSGALNYENLPASLVHDSHLIINTTPLGMSPQTEAFPDIAYEAIGSQHFVFDLIYNPSETPFLRKCKLAGASIKNGAEMLKLQAEKSWEIWSSNDRPND
ncbi:MAG: shikimate dehydrogenase [Salibacteraceae bacterium]|nr:shikimate dehydrogenase [Salibacteraceae bacterium]